MNPMLYSTGHWLLHSALAGSLLLLVTSALMICIRQPVVQKRLGEWGLLAALAAAALCVGPAWLILPWNLDISAAEQVSQSQPSATPLPGQDSKPLSLPAMVWSSPASDPETESSSVDAKGPNSGADVATPSTDNGQEQIVPASQNGTNEIPTLALEMALLALALTYAGGVLWCLARLGLAVYSLQRLARSSAAAPESVALLLRQVAGTGRQPLLRVSSCLRTPVSFGLIRATIILPADLCAAPDPLRLGWVLRHELAHLRRRDSWSGLLCAAARSVFFYVPFAWFICRKIRLCQEYLADAAAIAGEDRRADYAEFLLTFSRAASPPLLATGVSGNRSDLFRRVTMLLEKPIRVQSNARGRWLLFPAAGLLALAVLVSGIGFGAHASDRSVSSDREVQPAAPAPTGTTSANEAPPKENPQPMDQIILPDGVKVQVPPNVKIFDLQDDGFPFQMPGFDELTKALKKLQDAKTPDEIQAVQQEMMKALHKIQPAFGPNMLPPGGFAFNSPFGATKSRLGAVLAPPSKVITEQLNLPAGKGLVVNSVVPGSAADKAGIKANDILMKLDGKDVPASVHDFNKALEQIKADATVDAVVLRKGKQETIKGITLPKQADNPFGGAGFGGGLGGAGGINFIGPGGFGKQGGVQINMFRTNDKFNCRYQEGTLIITITGSVDQNNKSQVEQIHIQDGAQVHEYKNVKDVPAQYREKVNYLIDTVNKGTVQIQIQGQ
jgi:beta-lactamase regulating signal transducer with metallopeptidase domain